jgi:hypothetical protein
MAGSPIKHLRNQLFRDAVVRALKEGGDPGDYMRPVAEKLRRMALEGADDAPTTLAALREIVDRVDGKVVQQIEVERTDTTIDASLLGSMGELLKLVQPKKEKEVKGEDLGSVKS